MYSKLAEEDDNKMAERWQKDAEGIIIFNGLFSAVVAALVILSIADLKPDPQEKSAFYLERIYLNQANASNSSTVEKYTFSTPRYSVWANSLWLLSLVISLTCAMLATSVQQWARRYVRVTQPARCSPKQRARMRAFFAHGVDQFHVSWAVEALPALVHLALIIFFAGLLIFLFNNNFTVFTAVVAWVGVLALIYGTITLMPIFRPDSPYYAPLSSTAWFLYVSIQDALMHCRWDIGTRQSAAEEAASARSSEIDVEILEWTVDALADDDAQEKFFESLPGFYNTDLVKDPLRGLPEEIEWKILGILNEFLRRTLSSNSVSGVVKCRRLAICLNVASEVRSSFGIRFICRRIIEGVKWSLVPESVDIGHFLRSWDKSTEGRFTRYIQGIISHIIAGTWERNDRWMKLVMDHLDISEHLLHEYLDHGESVLFANLIHLTQLLSRTDWVTPDILRRLMRFDVRSTHPRVQHKFCAMWNEVVQESRRKGALSRLRAVLKAVRPIYYSLHQDEPGPSGPSRPRNPLCTNVEHDSGWTQDVQEVSVLTIGEPVQPRASTSASAMAQHPSRASASARAAVASSSLIASHLGHATLLEHLSEEPSTSDLPGPSVLSSHPTYLVPPPDPAIPIDSTATASTPVTDFSSDVPSDEPSPSDLPGPSVQASHPTDPVPPPHPATPVDSAATTSAQATAPPDVPSTTISDLRSTATATAPVQQSTFAPLSGSTDTPHDDGDRDPVTPSMILDVPVSSSPIPLSSDALPTDAQSTTSTATHSGISDLVAEDPLPDPATTPPDTARQQTSDTPANDDFQDLDVTPTSSHDSTQPAPDIAEDLPPGSPGTTSSSHDFDHSQ